MSTPENSEAAAMSSAMAGEDAVGIDCNAVDDGTAEVIGSASKEAHDDSNQPQP